MAEHEINGIAYRVAPINAMTQFKVAKRLMPVIGPVLQAATPVIKGGGLSQVDALASLFEPLSDAVSRLSDADADYIIATCLAAVTRQDGQGWVTIWNQRAGCPQYQDISLPVMLQLVAFVIMDQLEGFFPSGLPSSSGPSPIPASMP